MNAEDRETLSLGLIQGASLRALARVLGRVPSTLSREYARKTTRGRPYRAGTAQTQAATRAPQPRRSRTLVDPWLWQYVQTQLAQGCSPDQIAGRLHHAYPDDMRKHLSAETIYVGLYVAAPRHAAERTVGGAASGAQHAPASGTGDGPPRPDPQYDADCRAPLRGGYPQLGHWEGDLIKGGRNGSAVGTLLEQTTRLVILAG